MYDLRISVKLAARGRYPVWVVSYVSHWVEIPAVQARSDRSTQNRDNLTRSLTSEIALAEERATPLAYGVPFPLAESIYLHPCRAR